MSLRILLSSLLVGLAAASCLAGEPVNAHPCRKIIDACKAAGFERGREAASGKHLFRDCVKPLALGQKVEGVSASQADALACKEKREKKWRERHENQ